MLKGVVWIKKLTSNKLITILIVELIISISYFELLYHLKHLILFKPFPSFMALKQILKRQSMIKVVHAKSNLLQLFYCINKKY